MRPSPLSLCAALLLAAIAAPPAIGRDALGVYGSWGAFRDAVPARCYAISEPRGARDPGGWRAFAAIATWPTRGVRGQIHVRLSRARGGGAAVSAQIGDRRFPLVAGATDAWAPDPRGDAAIIPALRSGNALIVRSRDPAGHRITDIYPLRGAATAIDAAALACAAR